MCLSDFDGFLRDSRHIHKHESEIHTTDTFYTNFYIHLAGHLCFDNDRRVLLHKTPERHKIICTISVTTRSLATIKLHSNQAVKGKVVLSTTP
jgi:hypothetical protein